MSGSLTDPFSEYGGAIVWVAIVLLWYYGRWLEALLIALMLPLRVLVHFPKALVDRDRPSELFEGVYGRGGGLSFTSGHAEWLITFYGFLAFLAVLQFRHPAARTLIAGAYIAFLIFASFGRIHDGNHWPLDMVGGWIAGIGLLSGIIWLRRSLIAAGPGSLTSSIPTPFAALRRDA